MNRYLWRNRGRTAAGSGGGSTADVPITLVRVASGTASTLLTGSIPLAPGDLASGGARALYVGGVEVTANLVETGRPHPDGSVRAIRVQHTRSMTNGSDVTAVLKLGVAQTLSTSYTQPTMNTTTQSGWQTQVALDGVIVSTDATRICASGLLGRLSPRPSSIPSTPTWLATLESRWDSIHDVRFTTYAGDLENASYGQYDPIYQNMVRWARTGSVSTFLKALALYGLKRNVWWIPISPPYGVPEYLLHQQGLAAMAVVLDDATVRAGHLNRVTVNSNYCSTTGYPWTHTDISSSDVGDARTSASTLWMMIACDRMGDGLYTVNGNTIREWIRLWTLRIRDKGQWVNEATGQYSYKSQTDTAGNPGSGTPAWSNNFQNALLCDVLCVVHDDYLTDSTEKASIKTRITQCMEWMWQTQFFPSATPSPYQSLASRVVTGYTASFPQPAVDLGMLWNGAIMWLAENVDRSTWQTRADVLFDVAARTPMDGSTAPYMDPSLTTNVNGKVTNENFLYMGRALARRV